LKQFSSMLRDLGDKKNHTSKQFHAHRYLYKCYLLPRAERYTFVRQGEDCKTVSQNATFQFMGFVVIIP